MSRLLVAVAAVMMIALGGARAAYAQIKMSIEGPQSRISPIAVSGLKNLGGDDSGVLSDQFVKLVRRDLALSGYFRIIDPKAYIENPQTTGYDIGQFNFADWSSINADFVVKGAVSNKDGQVSLEALLFDVAQQRRMMGKQFNGGPADESEMARRFADAVLEAVTGVRGPFDTRIAFVSTDGGRFKEIYTAAPDGGDLFRVTNNQTINLFPTFVHGPGQLLYVSYKSGEPALYLANPGKGEEVKIESGHGTPIGGALTPDGNEVVAAVENGGRTNLYLLDSSGGDIRQLTHGGSINVNPAISTDGQNLAFTSDRSGSPQIYVMPLAGGDARRVTYQGNYNTSPAFSPKGDWIAYQSRGGGVFSIYMVPTVGGDAVQLTDEKSSQSPSWSPDGRYIIFSARSGGRERLYLMQVNTQQKTGKIISALMEDDGNDSSPAWSWWMGE